MQNTFLKMGYQWLTRVQGSIKAPVTAEQRACEGSELPGRAGIQAEVGQPLSEMRHKGSNLISYLFTQPKIPDQVQARTCVRKTCRGLFLWRRHRTVCRGSWGLGLERGLHGFQKVSVSHLKLCAKALWGDKGPLVSSDSKKGSVTWLRIWTSGWAEEENINR